MSTSHVENIHLHYAANKKELIWFSNYKNKNY